MFTTCRLFLKKFVKYVLQKENIYIYIIPERKSDVKRYKKQRKYKIVDKFKYTTLARQNNNV